MSLPPPATLNPARVWRAGMNPEVLLAAKLAWLLLVCSGFLSRVGHPGLAAVEAVEVLHPVSAWLMLGVFVAGGVALLANQLTRVAAVAAGVCVLLTPLGSLAAWRSHEWICGAVLVLAGLDRPGGRPWLLRAQATLGLLAVLLDHTGAIDWAAQATLEGWQVDRDTPSLILWLRGWMPAGAMRLLGAWLVPASALAIATALWIPRARGRGVWCACAWLLAGYVLVGTDETGFFAAAMLIAMLAWLDWPRESLSAHWPRACGWPMWLRIALDHYDFDQKTEWPFPNNPDADLDVWVDGRHLQGSRAILAMLLYFPLFHLGVFALVVALLLLLPQPWAALAHASAGLWLLAIFAMPTIGRLRRKLR